MSGGSNGVPPDKETSLGELLIRMRILTVDDLAECLHKQLSNNELMGQILLHEKKIDTTDLKAALEVQDGLRSHKKHVRAMTMARLSEMSGKRVVDTACQLREESYETRTKVASGEYPKVTKKMLRDDLTDRINLADLTETDE